MIVPSHRLPQIPRSGPCVLEGKNECEQNIVDSLVLRQPRDRAGIGIDGPPEKDQDCHADYVKHQPDPKPQLIGHELFGNHGQDGTIDRQITSDSLDHRASLSNAPL